MTDSARSSAFGGCQICPTADAELFNKQSCGNAQANALSDFFTSCPIGYI
jgi:hypothetical protein